MYMSKFKVISQNILLAVIALVPILFLPLSVLSLEPLKTFVFLSLGVVFTLGIILYKIKQDSFYITRNSFILSIIGIIFSGFLATVLSNNIGISLMGRQLSYGSFFGLISLCALMFVVYSCFDGFKEKTRLFLTMYVSGIVVVVIHLLSIMLPFFPTLGFFVNNTINTIGGWHDLGFFALFIVLSSVLVLQFLGHSKFYRIIGWIGFVVGITLMVLVNSVVIFVLAVIFSLLYIVLNAVMQHDFELTNRISYEALIILVVSIIFMLIGGKTGVLLNSALGLESNEVRPSLVATYNVTKEVIMNKPISGVGLDRFDTAWLLYRPIESNITRFWDTDFRFGYSTILSMGVTQGIVGILAWLAFIVIAVYFSFKLLFVPTEQKSELFMYMYSVLGFMFFLVVMIVHTPSVVLVSLMFIFMGLFLSNLKSAGLIKFKQIAINQNPRISFVYILSLVLLLIAFIYVGYTHLSQYSSRVLFEQATAEYNRTGNIQILELKVNRAQFIYSSDMYVRALAEIGMLKINQIVQNKEITQEQAVSQFTDTLRTTIAYAQSAIAYDPQSYINKMALVNVYKNLIPLGVADAKTEALALLDATTQLTPSNPTISLEKARVFVLAQEFDSAIEQIKKAIELKPNYVDAVFLLSQIQVEKGEINEAISSIQSAIQVDPYNANLRFQLGLLYYNQEKFNDAVGAFEDAAILSPSFANAKYFLGLSYYKNNRTSDSIKVFENLSAQVPENPEVRLILSNLKSGNDPFEGIQPPLDNRPEQREELPLEDEEVEDEAQTQE